MLFEPLTRQDLTSDVGIQASVAKTYFYGAGILTSFPIVQLELPLDLGPTNPQLTNIAVETVPYQSPVFLTQVCCY